MSKIAAVTGLLLIVLGCLGYFLTPTTVTDADGNVLENTRSLTAFIPAGFGLPILLCGIWGMAKPGSAKHAMHSAVLVATLGALAATGRGIVSLLKLINADGDFNQRAFVFLVLMGGVCWMFVIACINSFVQARKSRTAEDALESVTGENS